MGSWGFWSLLETLETRSFPQTLQPQMPAAWESLEFLAVATLVKPGLF